MDLEHYYCNVGDGFNFHTIKQKLNELSIRFSYLPESVWTHLFFLHTRVYLEINDIKFLSRKVEYFTQHKSKNGKDTITLDKAVWPQHLIFQSTLKDP